MYRSIIAATMLAVASFAAVPAAHAEYDAWSPETQATASYTADQDGGAYAADQGGQDRLLIVDRNKRRVIYDDGRNDLFCVTGLYIAGYTWNGYPIYRRNMRCR